MKWKEITHLEELDSCVWCDEPITSSLFITQTGRKKLVCNSCNCIMYENRERLWYIVPDMTIIKQKELTGYYGSKV